MTNFLDIATLFHLFNKTFLKYRNCAQEFIYNEDSCIDDKQ
jgi:hypothetical protein